MDKSSLTPNTVAELRRRGAWLFVQAAQVADFGAKAKAKPRVKPGATVEARAACVRQANKTRLSAPPNKDGIR